MARPPYSPEEMMEGDTGPDTSDEEMLETVRQGMGRDPRGAAGEDNKMSQEEANYRQGNDRERCELCEHYLGGDQCAVVQSPVAPDGLSDEFAARGGEGEGQGAPGNTGGGMY